jgi:hypothetical protein
MRCFLKYALERNNVYSSMALYVHVRLYNPAEQMF